MPSPGGTSIFTTSGNVIGKTGDALKINGVQIASGTSTTASVVSLWNGSNSSGTVIWQGQGVAANQTNSPPNFPAAGIYFPIGAYITWDTNGIGANVQYEQVATLP